VRKSIPTKDKAKITSKVPERDASIIGSFAKGLSVIECFDRHSPRLSIADVSQKTGLERATARRFLLTLVKFGYAEFDGKFFTLTPRALRLGYAYLSSTPMPAIIQRVIEPLSVEIGESLSGSTLDGDDIVYIARASHRHVMSISLTVGSRLPAYCTSMGRVLLASLPPEEARQRLKTADRRKITPFTMTGLGEIMDNLALVRSYGYAMSDQELELGLISIAVPVMNASGRVVASINCGSHATRLSEAEMVEKVLPKLKAAAQDLKAMLVS